MSNWKQVDVRICASSKTRLEGMGLTFCLNWKLLDSCLKGRPGLKTESAMILGHRTQSKVWIAKSWATTIGREQEPYKVLWPIVVVVIVLTHWPNRGGQEFGT